MLLIFLTFTFISTVFSDIGDLVKSTVPGNEAVLFNCSNEQDMLIEQCYLELFQTYNLNYTSLPGSDADPFKPVRYDANNMCKNYQTLRNCGGQHSNCFNFNTFRSFLDTDIDSEYYVSQTAFLEFYCNHGNDFVLYYECMQTIDMDDLSATIYTECSELEIGTCDSVSKTTQCERAVVRKSCISLKSINAYCQYSKILASMNGWDQCEYMPCVNSAQTLAHVFTIITITMISSFL